MDIDDIQDGEIFDENEQILEREYKKPKSQNCHIGYFYLIIGEKDIHKRAGINDLIKKIPDIGFWDHFKTEWAELLIGNLKKMRLSVKERRG